MRIVITHATGCVLFYSLMMGCHIFAFFISSIGGQLARSQNQGASSLEYLDIFRLLISSLFYLLIDPCSFSKCEEYYGKCMLLADASGTAQCTCRPLDQCPEDVKTVCGDNGKTYRNVCDLEAESCQMRTPIAVKHKGLCSEYYARYFKVERNPTVSM